MDSGSQNILLIEDSEADHVLITAMLSERIEGSWRVETRSTLSAGLELLSSPESASRFAAVLLDLSLPDSHGLETFRAVRQALSWMPIVVLTGNDDEAVSLEAVLLGAQDYLFKNSLTSDLLRKSLRYAIERKRLERTWREELEQRVRERTAELSAANSGLQREIAERRRVEDALLESRRFVERITNATPSIVFILDVVARTLIYSNEQLPIMLGYPQEEIRSLDDIIANKLHIDDLTRLEQAVSTVYAMRDDQTDDVVARIQHADGNWRWLHVRTVVFRRSADGAVRLVLGSAFDVTNEKLAEESVRHQQEQLIHASRITMLGELASGLAHELNQPLMAVSNYSHACLRRLRSGEYSKAELEDWLEKCGKQALLAGEIIKRLRKLVTKRPPEQTDTDVNETIRDVLELIRPEAEGRDIHIRTELSDTLPVIHADRIQLQQVLLNLIRNGFEAMQDTPLNERSLTVESARNDGESLSVSVSDRGDGCGTNQLDRLFEPFFSTKKQGLGMGLSISKSIIEAHGGRLTAQSNAERGLTFRFSLPLNLGGAG